MIWSDKTREAVARAISDNYWHSDGTLVNGTQAALAAVAESDEWKAKDQEIERLKRQVSVLREGCDRTLTRILEIDAAGEALFGSEIYDLRQALAAADKIGGQ